jgi:hypothetical protein
VSTSGGSGPRGDRERVGEPGFRWARDRSPDHRADPAAGAAGGGRRLGRRRAGRVHRGRGCAGPARPGRAACLHGAGAARRAGPSPEAGPLALRPGSRPGSAIRRHHRLGGAERAPRKDAGGHRFRAEFPRAAEKPASASNPVSIPRLPVTGAKGSPTPDQTASGAPDQLRGEAARGGRAGGGRW